MINSGNQFIELLNNKDKKRSTCLLAFLKGKIDGKIVTDLKPAQNWCFDKEQNWNQCYTARYQAGGKGGVIAPLIRQFVTDVVASIDFLKKAPGKAVGELQKADKTDWMSFEEAMLRIDTSGEIPEDELIKNFASVLESVFDKGKRLVLFCEINSEENPDIGILGLDASSVIRLIEILPERFALVISGVEEQSQYTIHESINWLTVDVNYLSTEPPEDRSQRLFNDTDEGDDKLNIQSEVNALADAIASKDMEPPLVLGILGGWGSGKSYVMNLLKGRLLSIRKKNILESKIRANFPYVGHFYLVRFDAWTYAKSDLWASLMQEVLLALNDQIAFEQLCVNKDTEHQEDLKLVEAMELALGNKEKFDKKSLETFIDHLPVESKFKKSKPPSPAKLTTEYLDLKRELFDNKFKKLLNGEDDFEPNVVERLSRDDANVRELLEHLDNDILWSRLQGLNLRLQAELENEENNLNDAKLKLSESKVNLEETVDKQLQKEHWLIYAKTLKGTIGKYFGVAVEEAQKNADDEIPVTLSNAIESIGFYKKVIGGASVKTIASFFLFALVTGIVTSFTKDITTELIGIAGFIGGALGGVFESWNRANNWLRERIKEFQNFDTELMLKQDERREALISNALSSSEYQTKVQEVADLESKVKTFRRKVGLTAGHRTLLDFIANRLQEGGYEERLGPLHQIQNDMQQLSEGLYREELCVRDNEVGRWVDIEKLLFPRGLPRVVLFIDDLDRCPPGRVVEVLEAAQLLVKTNLFVVVIAMDVRYVTKALEKAYEGVLDRQGAPSGLDYIEKIVQIPYRIRSISEDAMPGYLASQIQVKPEEVESNIQQGGIIQSELYSLISAPGEGTIRVDETVPQNVLSFDKEELDLVQKAALAVTISPRATKRLLNVMKLIKIIWYRTGEDDVSLDIKKTVIFFLTISARFAEIMRRVLFEVEGTISNSNGKSPQDKLTELLTQISNDWSNTEGQSTDWQFLDRICKNTALLPQSMTLKKLGNRNVELIRSFSFVGEVHIPPNPSNHQVSMHIQNPVKTIQMDQPKKP